MKVTIIGFWGGYPAKGEASSGYLLEHEGFRILVDCGSGVLSKLQTYIKPTELDAVFLTHFHPDHDADIGVFQHALMIDHLMGNEPVSIPVYAHGEDLSSAEKLNYKTYTHWKPVHENEELELGPFTIRAMKTIHSVPCYAFTFSADGRMFGYTGDTSFKEELIPFFNEADLLLCECNFYEGMPQAQKAGHLTSIDAARIARESGAKKLVLTHLPHFGELNELAIQASREYENEVSLAKTGLTITI